MAALPEAPLVITLVWAPAPRQIGQCAVQLPAGSTVADALAALARQRPDLVQALEAGELRLSLWGRKTTPAQFLHPHDRLELCRPLLVDPKVARRERFGRQGARAAGLFARRRPGGKPGY